MVTALEVGREKLFLRRQGSEGIYADLGSLEPLVNVIERLPAVEAAWQLLKDETTGRQADANDRGKSALSETDRACTSMQRLSHSPPSRVSPA